MTVSTLRGIDHIDHNHIDIHIKGTHIIILYSWELRNLTRQWYLIERI